MPSYLWDLKSNPIKKKWALIIWVLWFGEKLTHCFLLIIIISNSFPNKNVVARSHVLPLILVFITSPSVPMCASVLWWTMLLHLVFPLVSPFYLVYSSFTICAISVWLQLLSLSVCYTVPLYRCSMDHRPTWQICCCNACRRPPPLLFCPGCPEKTYIKQESTTDLSSRQWCSAS